MFFEKKYSFLELLGYSSIGVFTGVFFSFIYVYNYIDIVCEFFNFNQSSNLEKWNNLILEVSLLDYYKDRVYKSDFNQKKLIIDTIGIGFVKIEELKNNHVNFINDYIYNCSYNNYNKNLFVFETKLYFQKLKFLYADYIINSQILENNFSANEISPSKNNLNYLDREILPNSFSEQYRKSLRKSIVVGGFITPFEDFDTR